MRNCGALLESARTWSNIESVLESAKDDTGQLNCDGTLERRDCWTIYSKCVGVSRDQKFKASRHVGLLAAWPCVFCWRAASPRYWAINPGISIPFSSIAPHVQGTISMALIQHRRPENNKPRDHHDTGKIAEDARVARTAR